MLLAAPTPPLRVAVDLSFGALMNSKEHGQLHRQLLRVYGNNRKHASPLDLHLTGLELAPPACLPPAEHLGNWDSSVTLLQQPAASLWEPEEIVWLSPDAEEPLEAQPERDCIYVVGGLVDRSVAKGQTLRRAIDGGARARRLPIREFAPRSDLHPILTLPAVVHVLNEINGGQEWAEAFARAIPQSSIRRREKEADIRRGDQPRMLLADEHDHDEEERRRVWLGRTQVAAAHVAAARDISFTRSRII